MIKYPGDYNPILEYWDTIKYKPTFQRVESIKRDIEILKKKNKDISEKEKELQEALEEMQRVKSLGAVNTSYKVYRVYKHLVDDVINNPDSKYKFDCSKSNRVMEFIENFCCNSKGKTGGKLIVLLPFQKALIAALFGIVDKETNLRRFLECILIIGRKCGKSTLASAIACYMLFCEGEQGPEIVSASTKRDASKIIWEETKRMILKSPSLNQRAKCLVNGIFTDFNNGSFKALSSESNKLDGLNCFLVCIDELHAIADKNLYDVLFDSMSGRQSPISLITTTSGFVKESSIYDIKYRECENIIKGYDDKKYIDDKVLPIIYELDNSDEWTDEECWEKPNPAIDILKSREQLRGKVNKALVEPLNLRNLLCKDFNVLQGDNSAWLNYEQFNNEDTFDIKVLKPRYCLIGLDLSSTTDMSVVTVLFKVPNDETFYVKQMAFLPEDNLTKKGKHDGVPYEAYLSQDLLRTTPGNKIDYRAIVDYILEVKEEWDVFPFGIFYDSWSASYLIQELKDIFGDVAMPIQQGYKSLSLPMKELGALFESKKINYDNNPLLKYCIANTSVKIDINNNIMPIKSQQNRRIDSLASLLDAYVGYTRVQEEYMAVI